MLAIDSQTFFIDIVDIKGGLQVAAMRQSHGLLLLSYPGGDIVSPAALYHERIENKDFFIRRTAADFKTPLQYVCVDRLGERFGNERVIINPEKPTYSIIKSMSAVIIARKFPGNVKPDFVEGSTEKDNPSE